ncbi:MAG TPA: DUF1285 domain-containing protein [Syntrophales bacterium]|nr:DUF1285 domain-containing protein [Syntrophales bacterium]HPQ44836.1 DUF1285 domain-containing protein [Syntrophales bacterium]
MGITREDEIPFLPIRIDKEGVWHYKGARMFRKDILILFFENLKQDVLGRYVIELEGDRCLVEVEDTPFVVRAVSKHGRKDQQTEFVEILLSNFNLERLDPSTLQVGTDNVLYCNIMNGKFKARFSRPGYYQIAELIEYDVEKDAYYMPLNDKNYYIET